MNYKLLKQAAEVIRPEIDWEAAQKSNEVGFVSPADREFVPLGKTESLPAPTGPYKAPKPVKKERQTLEQSPSTKIPKPYTAENPLPMTPGLAQLYNEELRNEETPRYKSGPVSEGSPWHPGYSRVPNTVDPNTKNWGLNEPEAAERLFGPPETDWRKRNPATWFNIRTYPKTGVFDEEVAWDNYMKNNSPYTDETPVEEESKAAKEERNLKEWAVYKRYNPHQYNFRKQDELASMRAPYDSENPNNKGPFTNIDATWDDKNNQANLRDTSLFFPDQVSVDRGLVSKPDAAHADFSIDGLVPIDILPPHSRIMESVGAHEGSHNIVHALSSDSPESDLVTYPLNERGLYNWQIELPTIASEAMYKTDGKFVPPVIPGINKPFRDEEDIYLHHIMPPALSARVAMSGEIDPNEEAPVVYVGLNTFPEDLYNKGIRYWNGSHDKDRTAAPLKKLRFVPDHPDGWYYDRFGNKRLSGGELINYEDLYGDGKPKDMSQLSPNTRRYYRNFGQAPQAWIDAIEHPEEYAAAQDKARRIMFPLLRKDISGMFRDGDAESIKLLRDYQHPAFQMITDLVDGRNFFDLTDQERSDIMNKVEAIYPELRLDPVATPSWLVHAQKEFGLLPEMGVTGVRTLDQYNDIARYDAFYRALDEYLNQYGDQGGGHYGI